MHAWGARLISTGAPSQDHHFQHRTGALITVVVVATGVLPPGGGCGGVRQSLKGNLFLSPF